MIQSLALASGYAQDVPFYVKSWPWPTYKSHTSRLDPEGKTVWEAGECIWRKHGVWDWDEGKKAPVVLWENYFSTDNRPGQGGRPIEWYRDFYAPFCHRFSERLLRNCPTKAILVEQIPNEFVPPWPTKEQLASGDRDELERASKNQKYAQRTFIDTPRPRNFVYGPHFYDLNVVFGKVWRSFSVNVQGLSRGMFIGKAMYWGEQGVRQNYLTQLKTQAKWGRLSLGEVPILVGEIGLPYDINDAHGYKTGDYRKHVELVDALLNALEQNWESFAWWNFNPDCVCEVGDAWNKEDFSVIALDEQSRDKANVKGETNELYKGGRVLEALIVSTRDTTVTTRVLMPACALSGRTRRRWLVCRSRRSGTGTTGSSASATAIRSTSRSTSGGSTRGRPRSSSQVPLRRPRRADLRARRHLAPGPRG